MEKLDLLTSTMKEIETLSDKVVKQMHPLMREIEDDPIDFISEIGDELGYKEVPESQHSVILELLKNQCLEMLQDSVTLMDEIASFAQRIADGNISEISSDSPFLCKVWHGDIYDSTGIDALRNLVSDLKKQQQSAKRKTLVGLIAGKMR